jgi:hypothetical protein
VVTPAARQAMLRTHADDARRCWELARLRADGACRVRLDAESNMVLGSGAARVAGRAAHGSVRLANCMLSQLFAFVFCILQVNMRMLGHNTADLPVPFGYGHR